MRFLILSCCGFLYVLRGYVGFIFQIGMLPVGFVLH